TEGGGGGGGAADSNANRVARSWDEKERRKMLRWRQWVMWTAVEWLLPAAGVGD
ncbi:hypothetical protein Tco_1489853, partial [Tanacetum coccineum]